MGGRRLARPRRALPARSFAVVLDPKQRSRSGSANIDRPQLPNRQRADGDNPVIARP
ncbi:hypothetical protein Ae356Ps1_6298c [Pseudonocardia sp. Ae356_Ps1]|nr:hypothetical protein Ae356Ps1_6298c [Pseudonocardia sp. Ae356_Ps1]